MRLNLNPLHILKDTIEADLEGASVFIETFEIDSNSSAHKQRSEAGLRCVSRSIENLTKIQDIKFNGQAILGKNEFGAPIFSENFIGSISHSNNIAISVASLKSNPYISIGIDIETKIEKSLKVLPKIATESEINVIPFDGYTKEESATAIFCIKEAFYKAVNVLNGLDNCRLNPSWHNLTVTSLNNTTVTAKFDILNNPNLDFQIYVYKCILPFPLVCSVVVCR